MGDQTQTQDQAKRDPSAETVRIAELEAQLTEATQALQQLKAKAGEADQYRVGIDKLSKSNLAIKAQLLREKAEKIARAQGAEDMEVLKFLPLEQAWGENDSLDESKIQSAVVEHKKAHPSFYPGKDISAEMQSWLPPLVDGQGQRTNEIPALGRLLGLVQSGAMTLEEAKVFRASTEANGAVNIRKLGEAKAAARAAARK